MSEKCFVDQIREALQKHDYDLVSPIGSGGYGSCFLVKSTKYNISFVAKIIDEKKEQTFYNELDALRQITHPHILKLYDYFKEDKFTFLVNEYCSKGNLFSQIHGKTLSDSQVFTLAREIADALNFCHKKGIAHLDIKPSNIFIDSFGRTKLADFGLANIVKDNQLINQFKGSIAYCPPEIIEQKPFDPFKADVWSYGMTVFHIAAGSLPWMTEDINELRIVIPYGINDIREDIDPFLKTILIRCFNKDPQQRPTMSEIVELLSKPAFPSIQGQKPIKLPKMVLAQPTLFTKIRSGSVPRLKVPSRLSGQITLNQTGTNKKDSLPQLHIPK